MHTVEEITESVIGMVIAIHRDLGPGLLESAYQRILYDELVAAGFSVELEQLVAVTYNGRRYEHSFRADIVVEKKLVLEIKATERASSLHTRQLLTYLRCLGIRHGLLVNFGMERAISGIDRIINYRVPAE